MTTTITSTLRPGSRAWSADDEVVFDFLGSSAYSGAVTGFQADCSPGLMVIPGSVHGVAPVLSSDPIGGNTGWASGNGQYGFGGGGQNPGQQDVGGTATISEGVLKIVLRMDRVTVRRVRGRDHGIGRRLARVVAEAIG